MGLCRRKGMSAQEAFDYLDSKLRTLYREWYLTMADVPQWGEKIDSQVQTYIEGLENSVKANLAWR